MVTPHVLCGIPSVRICSGRASTSRVCSTSWDTPAPASPWMSTPTRTTTPSSTPLIRSQPTCDRIKTGHFPYTASYTICVETYPYLCRFTGDPNFGRAPQNPAKSLRQKGYGGLYTSAWAASKSPGRASTIYSILCARRCEKELPQNFGEPILIPALSGCVFIRPCLQF